MQGNTSINCQIALDKGFVTQLKLAEIVMGEIEKPCDLYSKIFHDFVLRFEVLLAFENYVDYVTVFTFKIYDNHVSFLMWYIFGVL